MFTSSRMLSPVISTVVVGIIFLLSLSVQDVAAKKKIPDWHIKMAQSQGPNTCAVEEIPGTNKKFWTECKYWMHRKICGKKTVIRYECCEGYDRIEGKKGCTSVKPLRNILETAEDLGATSFVQYLKDSGLSERLQREGAYTLFAPINSAFDALSNNQREDLLRSRGNPWSTVLLYHLAEGRIHSKDLDAEHLINSMNRGQQLRYNKYSNGMLTVNCAVIVRKDQEATNGMVHLVERLLEPIVALNLADALTRDGRFVELARLMRESQVADDLRAVGGTAFTIFAPYDEAFSKYPSSRLQRIRSDALTRRALLHAHVVPHSMCIPAVTDTHNLRTLSGERLTLTCNDTGTYVDGSRLSGEYIVANNGIVHLIGDVLVPDRAKSVLELAEDSGEVSTFLELVRTAGVQEAVGANGNFTIFAPSDEAFKDMPEAEYQRLIKEPMAARNLVMYHIVQGRLKTDTIRDDQKAQCVDGKHSLRMRVYRKVAGNKGYGVEAATMQSTDVEGQNGVVHVIDRIMKPPTSSIVEMLQRDGNFSIMLEALQKVRRVDPGLLSVEPPEGHGSLTLFAPSDEAFRNLGQEMLQKVMTDTEFLTQVVKNHIVNNMVPSCAFKSKLQYSVRTKQNFVEIHKKHHRMEVGGAHVLRPDLVTKDGIVHYVDRVILPDNSTCTKCKDKDVKLARIGVH